MYTNEKILIIENDTAWRDQFEKILRAIGEKREIKKVDITEFSKAFKTSRDFDNVGYCFVDLELGPGSESRINDMWGLELVLPEVRKLAPWIPVACISRYIAGQVAIVGDLSTSDFDGIYPKQIISEGTHTHPEFNRKQWNDLLLNLKVKRNAALTGRSVRDIRGLLENAHSTKLTLGEGAKKLVEEMGETQFREAVSLLGFGGTRLAVDKIVTGFSGVYVVKLGVYGEDEKGPNHSYWLLKWGNPVRKIAHEADAHKRLLRKGLERRLQVPLLHHNVISWEGLGFIAYVFEENARTALEMIQEAGVLAFSPLLQEVAKSLYSRNDILPISPREVLDNWWKLDIEQQKTIPDNLLHHTLEVTHAMIHGDFHLRNILVKSNHVTLIDFAKSDFNPIAIDVAKLIMDILVFVEPSQLSVISFNWEGLKASSLAEITQVFDKFLNARGDKEFFELALRAYAEKYLKYPDVDASTKKALAERLGKTK